ncbi:MAG TPA: phosphoenolpyruvate carboxykinase (ATP) [Chloroflexota bacterium]|nr:phosphoenolpyruvate carboxykinase (ATP) [Chloroflexota bacterium]
MVQTPTRKSLDEYGIESHGEIYWNSPTPVLYEACIRRREALLAQAGPLVVDTTPYTGRSPRDKYIVEESSSERNIWWGKVNQPATTATFDTLRRQVSSYLRDRDLFVQDLYAGADRRYRIPIRVISELPYHSLFARNMFIRPPLGMGIESSPEFTVLAAPRFEADAEAVGIRSGTFIMLNFAERMVLIGGTSYAGEIKKSIFSVLNYLLPLQGVLSMHCSANYGSSGDVALFFGLSGTGKTSLSTVHNRVLLGDDEHGWSDEGVFNFEGGSYAKTIRISDQAEPEIFGAVHRFGTVLENVVVDPETRQLDLDSDAKTENTRAAYPIDFLPNVDLSGKAGHPKNIIFLTADAFGVLPPIARLTPDQASYYYLSGYTAKVAGTERGVTEPEPNFSTCFGAPFLTLPPESYSRLLRDRIQAHGSQVWLVNTGWTGGPYGEGSRIKIGLTRAMVSAILEGQLDSTPFHVSERFGVEVPDQVPGVPTEVLTPAQTWADPVRYEEQAARLAQMFAANFRQFEGVVPTEVSTAGPATG